MKKENFDEASDGVKNMNIGNSSDVSEAESSLEYNENNRETDEDENLNIGDSNDEHESSLEDDEKNSVSVKQKSNGRKHREQTF